MHSNPEAVIVPLREDNVEIVKWTVYTAVAWNSPPGLPPLEKAVMHPDLARYHRGWGRPGDLGVKATIDDEFAGAAFARLFTDEDHGHGYVNDDTPELGIAVVAEFRGRGLGHRLMLELEGEARRSQISQLALSVNNPNPAKRLYERLGYRTIEDDGESSIMLIDLDRLR